MRKTIAGIGSALIVASAGVILGLSQAASSAATSVPMTADPDYTGPPVTVVTATKPITDPGLDPFQPATQAETAAVTISPYQAAGFLARYNGNDPKTSAINTEAKTFSATLIDYDGIPAYWLVWTGFCPAPEAGPPAPGAEPLSTKTPQGDVNGCGPGTGFAIVHAGGETPGAIGDIGADAAGDPAIGVPPQQFDNP